jgi:hypothetical protein
VRALLVGMLRERPGRPGVLVLEQVVTATSPPRSSKGTTAGWDCTLPALPPKPKGLLVSGFSARSRRGP